MVHPSDERRLRRPGGQDPTQPASAAQLLFDRLDAAGEKVGITPRMAALDPQTRNGVADKLEQEAAQLLADKHAEVPDTLEGKTVVIEFARGDRMVPPRHLRAPTVNKPRPEL